MDGSPFDAPLPSTPLTPPLVVNGGFGEFRIGHFHAGFDFGTGERVGKPVLAPANGWVERVRASGVGYGRSVYLHIDDGRLLQFGHLDAFVEPLASYVRAKQDSSGQYEQDLWPESGRFRFRRGQTIAWSGESGAGGPHLHFEIRRGDMAYHPQRAGLTVADTHPPSLVSLTLEPLDDASFVAGAAGPHTLELARAETLDVIGRVRAIVGARDGVWRGVDRMVPWAVGMEWNGRTTECRFDSVSWATDMPEGEYVYDAGRVSGDKGVVLWSAAGFRPRVLHADVPRAEDAGTIVVRPGDPPRVLRLWARDLAGGVVERSVVVRAKAGDHQHEDAARGAAASWHARGVEFASFTGGFLRMSVAAAKGRGVEFQLDTQTKGAAQQDRAGWSAVFATPSGLRSKTTRLWLGRREFAPADTNREDGGYVLARRGGPADSLEITGEGGQRIRVPAGALFEDAILLALPAVVAASGDLNPVGAAWRLEPSLPLRRVARVSFAWADSSPPANVGLFRYGSDGWEWVGNDYDVATRRIEGDSRRLGRFALFRDDIAPRATLLAPPARALRGPYSRWAVEARVVENGSGVAARTSWFEVDGQRVPTEWDSEENLLRWRPAKSPGRGEHRLRIVVADRAGNVARIDQRFTRK